MKITKTLYVNWDCEGFNVEANSCIGAHYITDYDASKYSPKLTLLTTKEVEFEVPEVDAKGCLIESLERQLKKINDDAVAASQPIKEKLQQLLALPNPD